MRWFVLALVVSTGCVAVWAIINAHRSFKLDKRETALISRERSQVERGRVLDHQGEIQAAFHIALVDQQEALDRRITEMGATDE